MDPSNCKRLSCGIVILNPQRELLLCHVTGHGHWDLPKGCADEGETPVQTALRETWEETGLRLDASQLLDLGRFGYGARKQLHLFATLMAPIDTALLACRSYFTDRASGRRLPEMDGYRWQNLDGVAPLCRPKMAAILQGAINLPALYTRLQAPQPIPIAA
jgi:putative (di)nucleoside polyphosphate hydrolase